MEILNKIQEKIGLEKIFFISIVFIYIIYFFYNKQIFGKAIESFTKIILNIWWVIAIVFGFLFLVNLFLNEKAISKYVGKESGIKGWLIAIGFGLLSHGPIYLWYPVLGELKEKGMKNGLIATFMYNRAIKIPLLPLLVFYFGFVYTIVLTFWMIIISIITGLIMEAICNEDCNKQ